MDSLAGVKLAVQRQAGRAGHGAQHVKNIGGDGGDVKNRLVQRQLSGTHARQVQQVVDDARLAFDGPLDQVGRARGGGRIAHGRGARQQFGIQLDQVERVLQFVRHHGEELVFQHVVGAGAVQA
ncbi:hypothetical protein D3C72_1895010 [compost metagenome]